VEFNFRHGLPANGRLWMDEEKVALLTVVQKQI